MQMTGVAPVGPASAGLKKLSGFRSVRLKPDPQGRRLAALLLALIGLLFTAIAAAEQEVRIAEPFIELHTGPAAGYPVLQVVERGEPLTLLLRRAGWFKVRAADGREGWVPDAALSATLGRQGETVTVAGADESDFRARRWELGVSGGEFAGASLIGLSAGWQGTENLSLELNLSQALGRYSSNRLLGLRVLNQPFPDWRWSPYFALGAGIIQTDPAATLVRTEDREDEFATVGLGVKVYLTRRFMARLEYNAYVVFTSTDDNEEIDEWKAGFAFFF